MKYYANGHYYRSEIEAIEAITDSHDEIAAYDMFGKKIASWEVKNTAQLIYTNCRNCGAPVFGCKCDYCGTRY